MFSSTVGNVKRFGRSSQNFTFINDLVFSSRVYK